MSHHYEDLVLIFTDVELNDEPAIVSGEPVLKLREAGVVSPNEPLLQHFHSAGTVIQGTGIFESWVGRRAVSRGWLDMDPETMLPIHAWGPTILQ